MKRRSFLGLFAAPALLPLAELAPDDITRQRAKWSERRDNESDGKKALAWLLRATDEQLLRCRLLVFDEGDKFRALVVPKPERIVRTVDSPNITIVFQEMQVSRTHRLTHGKLILPADPWASRRRPFAQPIYLFAGDTLALKYHVNVEVDQ